MITLKEMLDDLAMGVLSNLAISDNTTGTINPSDYPKAISYINLALTAVHKRFLLRTGELIVQQHPDVVKYLLRSAFAASNTSSLEPIKYIIDTATDPFKDDILKIEQVFSEIGEEYPINDSTQPYPVYTSQFDVLSMVPVGLEPQAVFVIYRAKYPKIVLTDVGNPETFGIDIPDWILDALYARIAAQAHRGITGEETETSASRSYMFQYELECKRLETENITANDNDTSNNFEEKGWA